MAQSNSPATLEGIPAASPPPGVVPNPEHPYSSGYILIVVGTILLTVMLLSVCIRIYTKIRIVKKSSPDDYTCVIAAAGTVVYYVIAVLSVTIGKFGTHMWDLTAADLETNGFLMTGFFSNWVTTIVWPFAKLSFFLLYIQVFRPLKWLRYSSYAGATVNVLFYFSILVATLAFTAPAPGQTFEQAVQSPRENRALSVTLPIACMSLVLDVYILVLPIAAVSQLQLSTRRKIGVIAVFMTGGMACIASSLSIYYKWRLKKNDADLTYKTMPVILTCLVEMCIGVTASCMPSMANLLHHLPSWEHFSSKIISAFTSRLSSGQSKSLDSSGTYGKRNRNEYRDLGVTAHSVNENDYEMAPAKSIQTYIHTGGPQEVEEDGIHLQYNVEQQSATIVRDKEQPTTIHATHSADEDAM